MFDVFPRNPDGALSPIFEHIHSRAPQSNARHAAKPRELHDLYLYLWVGALVETLVTAPRGVHNIVIDFRCVF